MATMRIGAITGVGQTELLTVERPVPKKGEILVQVKACAICTQEQRVFRGITKPELPFLGGHEVSGVIAALGEGLAEDWTIGQRVVVRKFASCGVCHFCRIGRPDQCIRRERVNDPLNAGLGEYMALPEEQFFPYDGTLTFAEASLGEPVACVLHSIDQCRIDIGDDMVIIGAGIMGMLHLQIAKLRGARVIMAEIDPARRALAKELGADEVFDPSQVDQVEYVKQLTQGRGADVVVNTTSIYEVAQQAMAMAAPTGRTMMYASMHPDTPVPVRLGEMHNRETQMIGTISSTPNDFRRATKILQTHMINVKPLIARTVPLSQFQQAMELATPGTYRIVVTMDENE